MLARHVSDLTGPSSGAFFTSCMCRFGMCCNIIYYNTYHNIIYYSTYHNIISSFCVRVTIAKQTSQIITYNATMGRIRVTIVVAEKYRETQKNGNFCKTQQKFKKSNKKNY